MTPDNQQVLKLHHAAKEAMQQGQLREVHDHCLAILNIDPTFPDAWFLCGVIAALNGQITKATEILSKATEFAPENPEYRTELGKQLLANNEPERALREAELALSLTPTELPTLNTLGTLLSHAGEHEKALSCYERIGRMLKERPKVAGRVTKKWQADYYFNFAASLQFAGRFDEAESAYENSIVLKPEYFRAHSALSTLRRQTPENNHLERLQQLRDKVGDSREQLQIGHAIAKEQEDLGLYEEAFASLVWAKRAQAEAQPYDADEAARLFSGIQRLFTHELLESQGSGHDSREPIFVVGMPRTGTTLTEQILSSHSQVFGAGELQNFPLQVRRLTQSTGTGILDLETLEKSSQLDIAQLGSAYIESTRPRCGHSPHFVDKLPLNYLLTGLIGLALPNAKIVCLRRDPMDACLSNYRQIFAGNFRHYHYNLDLLDCGRYYIHFDRTLQHWHKIMPGRIFELQYEQLVEHPEQVTRQLLAHCELPWEEQCLAFHQRKTSVATPSAVQVRQGIYSSSVDRWRRYGDAMQPLYELLQSAGFYP